MHLKKPSLPLIVDLDGTLIKTDLFFESALIFVGRNFFNFFRMVHWFFTKGRSYLKLKLEKQISLNIPSLPYNKKVIQWLQWEKLKDRPLVLVTGSTQNHGEQIASHLNLFTDVFGVNHSRPRLTGKNKARFLMNHFGSKQFDYIGNSHIDYPVWSQARHCIIACAFPYVVYKARRLFNIVKIISHDYTWSSKGLGKLLLVYIPSFLSSMRVQNVVCRWIFYLIPLYFFNRTWNSNEQWIYSIHGVFILFFLYLSAFMIGELKHLHQDRAKKKTRLLCFLHPYWGLLFIPFFAVSIFDSLIFFPTWNLLWILSYFLLEAYSFLFRFRSIFLELIINFFVVLWSSILVM